LQARTEKSNFQNGALAKHFFIHVTTRDHVSESPSYIILGGLKFSRKAATNIGDVDSNGFDDYVIGNPKESKSSGAVRIFMMGQDNQIIRTRHIVPGKWGFQQMALREFDLFGSSVVALEDINDDGVPDFAVGAPGDITGGPKVGAIYTILLKRDGTILQSNKISASTDISLKRQHTTGEGFGTSMRLLHDFNGDKVREVAVESGDGSTTLLFLNQDGTSRAGIKFIKDSHTEVNAIKNLATGLYLSKPIKKEFPSHLNGISVRSASACVMNVTHCSCSNSVNRDCFKFVEKNADGFDICLKQACPETYRCDCGGEALCDRMNSTQKIYSAVSAENDGRFYCKEEEGEQAAKPALETTRVLPEEIVSRVGDTPDPAYNSTHCACAPKSALHKTQTCFDFKDNIPGRAVICNSRQCDLSKEYVCDLNGTALCERIVVQKAIFVNDGPTDINGEVYCHLQDATLDKVRCVENCQRISWEGDN
jgi:FG-GAP repeat